MKFTRQRVILLAAIVVVVVILLVYNDRLVNNLGMLITSYTGLIGVDIGFRETVEIFRQERYFAQICQL